MPNATRIGGWGVGRCLTCGRQNEMRIVGAKGTRGQAKCDCQRQHNHPSYVTKCRCRKSRTTHEQLTPGPGEEINNG